MNARRMTLLSLLVVLAFGLVAPMSALAAGGGSSAGDQQYVDPLGGNSGNSGSGSSGSSNSGSSGSSSSGSSSSGTSSSTGSTGTVSSSSASSTTTGSSTAPSTARTLPFTGFDAAAAIALGVVLIGSGFVLRRRIQPGR